MGEGLPIEQREPETPRSGWRWKWSVLGWIFLIGGIFIPGILAVIFFPHIDCSGLFWFKLALMPLAVWRTYRLVSLDTGPFSFLRWIRLKMGVKYPKKDDGSTDWEHWSTEDGSFAEGMTCS
jgi:hypothetical protein